MTAIAPSPSLKALAKDLSKEPPRSPRETLAGYVIAARTLDKCRAHLNETAGDYNFNQFMDKIFFDFTGIDAEAFTVMVAIGASDAQVADWIEQQAIARERIEIIHWNNGVRYADVREMPAPWQVYMEDYMAENLPAGKIVRYVLDIFDLEEGRL